jgi:hypothetical protein
MSALDMYIVFYLDQKKVDVDFKPDIITAPETVMLVTASDEEDANDRAISFFKEYYNTFMDDARTLAFERRQRACWVVPRAQGQELIERVSILFPNLRSDMQGLGYRYILHPMSRIGFGDDERHMLGMLAVEAALKR